MDIQFSTRWFLTIWFKLDTGTTTRLDVLTLTCAETETIHGNGNCLFSSLSFGLTKSFAYQCRLRQKICYNMDRMPFNNLQLLSPDSGPYGNIAEYIRLKRIGRYSVEGGDIEITTICYFSRIDVMVYHSNIKCWMQYNGLRAAYDVRPQVFLRHRGRH